METYLSILLAAFQEVKTNGSSNALMLLPLHCWQYSLPILWRVKSYLFPYRDVLLYVNTDMASVGTG